MKKSELLFSLARIISDGVFIFTALVLAYYVRMVWFEAFGLTPPDTLIPFPIFSMWATQMTLFLLFILGINRHYHLGENEKIMDELFQIFWGLCAGMSLIIVFFFFVKITFFSRFIFGASLISAIGLTFLGRIGLRIIRWQIRKHGIGRRKILILGTGQIGEEIVEQIKSSTDFDVLGLLTEEPTQKKKIWNIKVRGSFADLEKVLDQKPVEEVLLITDDPSKLAVRTMVENAHIRDVKFQLLPDEARLDLADVQMTLLSQWPILTLLNTRLRGWGMVLKYIIDYCLAVVALIGLSPVMGVIAFKIWQSNRNAPIFFASPRVGKNGKIFPCYKFRTMVPDADKHKKDLLDKNERKGGVFFKLEDDPRITPLGKILRKWSLDELPQLFNVLRGEISLIGPRPHLPEEVEQYLTKHRRILSIRPGITGFSQVNGRSSLSYEEEMKYELFYLKNWSLYLDGIIFLKSIWVVLQRKNAN